MKKISTDEFLAYPKNSKQTKKKTIEQKMGLRRGKDTNRSKMQRKKRMEAQYKVTQLSSEKKSCRNVKR